MTEWIFFDDEGLFFEFVDGRPTGKSSEDPQDRDAYECTFNRGLRDERSVWISN